MTKSKKQKQESGSVSKAARDGTAYILLSGTIDGTAVQEVATIIAGLPGDIGRLYFLINTGGGEVSQGFALHNLLRGLPYDCVMHNIANVDSIGNTVFLAADTRYACPNATFLLHRVKSQMSDTTVNHAMLAEKMSSVDADEKRIRKLVCDHTRLSDADLDRFFSQGEVKDAAYARSVGLVHDIRDVALPKGAALHIVKCSA